MVLSKLFAPLATHVFFQGCDPFVVGGPTIRGEWHSCVYPPASHRRVGKSGQGQNVGVFGVFQTLVAYPLVI